MVEAQSLRCNWVQSLQNVELDLLRDLEKIKIDHLGFRWEKSRQEGEWMACECDFGETRIYLGWVELRRQIDIS